MRYFVLALSCLLFSSCLLTKAIRSEEVLAKKQGNTVEIFAQDARKYLNNYGLYLDESISKEEIALKKINKHYYLFVFDGNSSESHTYSIPLDYDHGEFFASNIQALNGCSSQGLDANKFVFDQDGTFNYCQNSGHILIWNSRNWFTELENL